MLEIFQRWRGAYAVTTTTAAHNGNNGLWIYTGTETWAYWSRPYQEFSASPGQTYTGKAWIRTPSGESWVNSSLACVRIEFLNGSKSVLKAKNSSGITTANSGWNEYSVTSDAAPANTKYVRFICNIEKPSGVSGISVANFDDTYLELTAEATLTPVASPTTTIIPTPTTVPTSTVTPKVTPTPRPTPTASNYTIPYAGHYVNTDSNGYSEGFTDTAGDRISHSCSDTKTDAFSYTNGITHSLQ